MINQSAAGAAPIRRPRSSRQSKAMVKALAKNLVAIQGGGCYTTSVVVAEQFGKRHDNVLRAIETYGEKTQFLSSKLRNESCPDSGFGGAILRREITGRTPKKTRKPTLADALSSEQAREIQARFWRENFVASEYRADDGKDWPMYLLTEDAFLTVSMGFTGEAARTLRILFVQAFQQQKKELERLRILHENREWQELRASGKLVRKELVDGVQSLEGYAKAQDSEGSAWYYKHITMACYRAIFQVEDKVYSNLRERLNQKQLITLAGIEIAAGEALSTAIAAELPYKDCYEVVKAAIRDYAKFVGISFVPACDVPSALPEQEILSLFDASA